MNIQKTIQRSETGKPGSVGTCLVHTPAVVLLGLSFKRCSKCGQNKPRSEFTKYTEAKDGLFYWCRDCKAIAQRTYAQSPKGRATRINIARCKRWTAPRTKKRITQLQVCEQVRKNIKQGVLDRPDNCENCGITHNYIHGHHNDYSKPLCVEWLCPTCHYQRHEQMRECRAIKRRKVEP